MPRSYCGWIGDHILNKAAISFESRRRSEGLVAPTAQLNQLPADTGTLRDLWGLQKGVVVGLPIACSVRPFAKR